MKAAIVIFLLIVLPGFVWAQQELIKAGTYQWPTVSTGSVKIFSGSANDLSFVEMSANALKAGQKVKSKVPDNEEHLILIKSGTLSITIGDSLFSLGKGSIAMVMASGKYVLSNKTTETCEYHLMKYRSKLAMDIDRGMAAGGSFVKDWNKLVFKPHDRGGVRPYFERPTAMTKRFEMHVTTLKPNLNSHAPHTHGAEEIILVIEGNVEMLIGETNYRARAGELLFVPTNLPHGLKNDGTTPCSYFAFQW